jgi:hypothetical protein
VRKYKEIKPETTYVGPVETINLKWNYIIRVDKEKGYMTVYTFSIDSILTKEQLKEFFEEPNAENLKLAIADMINHIDEMPIDKDSQLVFGQCHKYIFKAKEKDFQLFSTVDKPKLIVTKESPFGYGLYLAPGFTIYPDTILTGRIGLDFGLRNLKFDAYFNNQKQIGIEARLYLIKKGG